MRNGRKFAQNQSDGAAAIILPGSVAPLAIGAAPTMAIGVAKCKAVATGSSPIPRGQFRRIARPVSIPAHDDRVIKRQMEKDAYPFGQLELA